MRTNSNRGINSKTQVQRLGLFLLHSKRFGRFGYDEQFLRTRLVHLAKLNGTGSIEYVTALTELFPFMRLRSSRLQSRRFLSFVADLLSRQFAIDPGPGYLLLKQLAWYSEEISCYPTAERCYLRALAVIPECAGDPHEKRARVLKSLSALYFKWGRQDEALMRAREAYDSVQLAPHASVRDRIEIIAHLGSLLGALGQSRDGVLYLVSALTLTESCDSSFRSLQADIADRIAEIAELMGEKERAFAYSQLSRKVRTELLQRPELS